MARTPRIFDYFHGDSVTSFHDMKDAGILIAIGKVSQGMTADPAFRAMSERAESVGMFTGGYHFGINADGATQADFFMARLVEGDLMVLDFEPFPKSQMTVKQAEDFVARVLEKTGNYPCLYYNSSDFQDLCQTGRISTTSILRQCPLWGSRYSNVLPWYPPNANLVMWQFTGDGVGPTPHKIAGCSNNADLSYWMGGDESNIPIFVSKHRYQVKS